MSKKNARWRKLDNAAKLYSAASNKKDTRVFRFYCELKEEVNPKALQEALNQTIETFPTFLMVLRKGFFWHYLEPCNLRPIVKEEYKDQITYEELGYKSYNANLESAYMEAMQKLENNSYSKEPVKTSYGYHVIYRIDQKEKPVLEDVKEEIIDSLVSEKKSEDKNISYVALDKMREESGLKFSDTVLEKKYNTYMSQYK